jgi:cleavage and polyadenylation specificity factor subunit 1
MLDQEFHTVRTKHTPALRAFTNITGFDGFFTLGPNSYLTFICPRSGLTPHPLWIDGPINSFVPLKNASITMSGFIYLNKNFDIRIATLPAEDGKLQIYYDSPWVLRKCQLRQTVHFLCYHEESKTYAVVTSVAEPTNKLMLLGIFIISKVLLLFSL